MLDDPTRQIRGLADIIDLASLSVSEPIETRFIGWGLSARPPSAKDAHCNSSSVVSYPCLARKYL